MTRKPPTLLATRLLKTLAQRIEAAPATEAALLRARRATVLVRHGDLEGARRELTALHQWAFQHPHPALGAWLQLAEGLMRFYTDFDPGAEDRVRHAHAIAVAGGSQDVQAYAAAWLAHLAYVRHDLKAMIQRARECLDVAAADDHGSRSRVGIVLALAWQFAGSGGVAQRWWTDARMHAIAEGDETTLSALIYNQAEQRTALARRAALAAPTEPAPSVLLGVDSVSHYDNAIGAAALAGLTPLLRAQTLAIQGDFAQAIALYEAQLPQPRMPGLARLASSLLADLAWCRLNVGQREQAAAQAREAEIELDPACDVDDRASTHSRLAQVYAGLGEEASAARHQQLAQTAWATFARQQADWLRALTASGLTPPSPSTATAAATLG